MSEFPVNKNHILLRVHFLNIICRFNWICADRNFNAMEHYFHHTYWLSDRYSNTIPNIDEDLYGKFRASKFKLKVNIIVKAPKQEKKRICLLLSVVSLLYLFVV